MEPTPRRDAADGCSAPLRFGALEIDRRSRRVTIGGVRLDLPRRELDLLLTLAEQPEKVFTRDELLRIVWQSSSDWQSSATVTEHVRRLRHKLAATPTLPVRIASVRGVGYRLEAIEGDTLTDPLALQGMTHSSLIVDGETIVDASGAAIVLFGADALEDLVGRGVLELVASRSLAQARVRLEHRAADDLLPPGRLWLRRLDGRELLADASTVPIDRDGRIHHRIDLWEVPDEDPANLRKVALGITSEVADAVIILDRDWHFQTVNAAAETMYGWLESELVGRTMAEVLPGIDDDVIAVIDHRLEEDGHWHGDVAQTRRDGSTMQVRASATLIGEDHGRLAGIVFVCRPHRARLLDGTGGPDVSGDIESGLLGEEFHAHYQPIVNLESHRIIGVEALARWHHPTEGVLAPGRFLEAMERTGSVVRLGRRMLAESAEQVMAWRDEGFAIDLAVNVSAQQLIDGSLIGDIAGGLAITGLDPTNLIIELTETDLIADVTAAAQILDQITATGVRVAIDDFGTGWASLTYLKRFPITVLKIDRMFTRGVIDRPNDIAIARSIISLGAELDLVVVAEGIESRAQETAMLELGCSIGQGNLYGVAQPAATMVRDIKS